MSGGTGLVARHPSLVAFLLVMASVLALLALLEGTFRVTRYIVRGPDSMLTVDDAELGWFHNVKRPKVTRNNSCGEEVVTLPPPNPYIIRYPRTSGGTHVLFLGDSSTHAHEVSTGAAYYDIFETMGQGRYSVWAAGAGGYGNLQEYLLLRKIYDEVRPSIVVWQLDSNDVMNNVYELDKGTIVNNQKPRPYLDPDTGTITLRNPGFPLFDISHGARFLFSWIVGLDRRYDLGLIAGVDKWFEPSPEKRPALVEQGLRVLDTVLGQAVRSYPQTRFVGFCFCSGVEREYAEVFGRHGGEYWPAFTERVRVGGERTDCLPWDGHWNYTGNRIAGRLIAELLESK